MPSVSPHDGLVDFTAFAIRVQFLMLPFVGFQIVSSNYFQATGQPAKSVFLTLTRQILFLVPLLYLMPVVLPQLFPQFTGLDALYFAAPVADFLSIFTTAIFVAWGNGAPPQARRDVPIRFWALAQIYWHGGPLAAERAVRGLWDALDPYDGLLRVEGEMHGINEDAQRGDPANAVGGLCRLDHRHHGGIGLGGRALGVPFPSRCRCSPSRLP